ncbi:polyphosphate kinase 1 [Sulfuriroseicoccus oceanibius]|uniref:Polyphosphate kinase n=1 Tax=Sulfuriroseicoccus oceanibius TaxID=2707525 RepID=A0A6B3LAU8_9BACT|nr:polyphosphate kinase 1 [Sulfuriroseicoccus oceanibius]QQL46148.1 polyphosphate kinase 1 [Sulfuriroseicoccus oceanibius]
MNSDLFINRELSWLEFNQRVLDEALDPNAPLLERLKFLAITGSNLDEFFMVRIGGLMLLQESGNRSKDFTGLTPHQQLLKIRSRVQLMLDDQYALLNEQLLPALEAEGIRRVTSLNDLSPAQLSHIEQYFTDAIFPIATPLAVDLDQISETGFPVPDLQIAVACELEDPDTGEVRSAVIPAPSNAPRFINLPDADGLDYIAIEDVISNSLDVLFPGEKVKASTAFRVTRNGDITLNDEDALDLADEMEAILIARKASDTIRLEIQKGAAHSLVKTLQTAFGLSNRETYKLPGLIDLKALMQIAFTPGFDSLKAESWPIQPSPLIDPAVPVFDTLAERDVLLYHPYESFDPIVRMLQEAANDPDVLAIKQILYRTASDSRIVDALIRAAEKGKQVTVLVELKARFDEARNLVRSDELQRAGATVIYGVKGLKTHAKCCMVVRNEGGRLRRYCHFGTGNYNESTAKLYTDVSLLTANPEYGADASAFFNSVTGRSRVPKYLKIAAAPHGLKPKLLSLIASETERAAQGQNAFIKAKVNSLQDPDIIEALYKASKAGVKVQLNVRGISCIRPGVKGLSENIEVVSIIDGYLEHARVMLFHQGGQNKIFISSADWMVRNLEKRVELLVPVDEKAAKKRLIRLLEVHFADNTKARLLKGDNTYEMVKRSSRDKAVRAQEQLAKEARKAAKLAERERGMVLEPHKPKH